MVIWLDSLSRYRITAHRPKFSWGSDGPLVCGQTSLRDRGPIKHIRMCRVEDPSVAILARRAVAGAMACCAPPVEWLPLLRCTNQKRVLRRRQPIAGALRDDISPPRPMGKAGMSSRGGREGGGRRRRTKIYFM